MGSNGIKKVLKGFSPVEAVSAVEKQNIVFTLLQGAACEEDIHKYKVRMKVNPYMDKTYPNCYIPPYNAKNSVLFKAIYQKQIFCTTYAGSSSLEIGL